MIRVGIVLSTPMFIKFSYSKSISLISCENILYEYEFIDLSLMFTRSS